MAFGHTDPTRVSSCDYRTKETYKISKTYRAIYCQNIMNINEFFERLEKEFGLTPYDYCKIKPISYSTLKKYLKGTRPTRSVAKTLERITDRRITLHEMGFDEENKI